MGHVGRFSAVDSVTYPRAARVVCRTSRGLEVGQVLSRIRNGDNGGDHNGAFDGTLLRGMTAADELLLARLERHKNRAYKACRKLLQERNIPAVLMEVEHLFDGKSLFFYFLGEVTPTIESVIRELTQVYEANVQFRRFAETLTLGCGPGCGTEEATGNGCGQSCGSCAISGSCAATAKP
jgi:cell fate regulator YaaT (PSP1 superfamily)